MTRAILISNPAARHHSDPATLAAALSVARAAGWDVTLAPTSHAGHATELARAAAADGIDAVIVHGGDGTLNEAVNGLARSHAALAVLPAGTANVWAKEIGIGREPVEAMRQIVAGARRRIDLGRAGDRRFLLMAGLGLDALVIPRVSVGTKRRLGAASFALAGARVALGTKPWSVDMRIDGQPAARSLYWMVIGNTRLYGGLTKIACRAIADDGSLDAVVMRRGGAHRLVRDGAMLFLGRHERSSNIGYTRARTIEIATPGIPVQVDGELCGETPMRFEVVPDALDVIVPAGLHTPLFVRAPEEARG